MKLRTIIVDDEPIALEKLRNYVGRVSYLQLEGAYSSAQEAVEAAAATNVDLVITDINMPDMNGMQLAEALSGVPMVVFVTAHAQFAVDSYRLAAVDYLLKPYSFADFQRAAARALELHASRSVQPAAPAADESLFVKVDYRYVRVALADILYIKGYGEYLQIYMAGAKSPLLTLSTFASISERLSPDFVQIHRSYIVNMNRVEQVCRGRVVFDADTYLPVSDSYKAALQQYLHDHSVATR
ncbi:MAG: LytTR family DNA-binding domain-containing protein [Muribaculaceae bacterium]|nr:LytTR family DNA-binding domain-containing protein [Muribaculaceae bacterium]